MKSKESPLGNREIANEIIGRYGDKFPDSRDEHTFIFEKYYPRGLINNKPLSEVSDVQIRGVAKGLYFNSYLVGFSEFTEEDKGVMELLIKVLRTKNHDVREGLEERVCIRLVGGVHPILENFYEQVKTKYFIESPRQESLNPSEKELLKKVHKLSSNFNWRIENHAIFKKLLKPVFPRVLDRDGYEVFINKASGEDFEKFVLEKLEECGLGIPPGYYGWEEKSE